ncbi:hypothetical protein OESDEN_24392, partial [Oesophagostomum dentatum]
MTFKPSMPLPPVKLPPRCLTHAHRRIYPPETNPADGKGYSYARGLTRRYSYETNETYPGMNRECHSSSTYRSHESRFLGSGDNDKHVDDFLPEYLRPPKDPFEDEPRFVDTTSLPNYLGNPNSIYRLRPHKSGSYGSSETSTGSSSSSNHYNHYFKNSATSTHKNTDVKRSEKSSGDKAANEKSPNEQPLDPLNPIYSTEYVGYSTTSDWPAETVLTNEEKCAIKLSQIFGWRKAVRVVKKHPRVRIVSRLVDFALVEPDEDDDDMPGEDVISYTDLVNLLKGNN